MSYRYVSGSCSSWPLTIMTICAFANDTLPRLPSRPAYPNSGFDTSDDADFAADSLPNAMRIVRVPNVK